MHAEKNISIQFDDEGGYALATLDRIQRLIDEYQPAIQNPSYGVSLSSCYSGYSLE